MQFTDLVDAVHDIKRTVESDGLTFVSSAHTISISDEEYAEVQADEFLTELPASAVDDLAAKKVLGVNINVVAT